jgi:hypothetical protein
LRQTSSLDWICKPIVCTHTIQAIGWPAITPACGSPAMSGGSLPPRRW